MARERNKIGPSTLWCWAIVFSMSTLNLSAAEQTDLSVPDASRGICVVIGLPVEDGAASVVALAAESELTVYFQSPDVADVEAVRRAAEEEGLLGTRVVAEQGELTSIHLASRLADVVRVAPTVKEQIDRQEVLRVVRPLGVAMLGSEKIIKPVDKSVDNWSHVYHGPDNNPQSTDQIARAPFRTQFLAEPLFSPMPEVTVAAGGRIFKAFGHIAHKANQNAVLNTLVCSSAYNGTILWQRPLKRGFMIHRSTMIATPDMFYMADDESCKCIDPSTGKTVDEITLPAGMADGPVWKWMALSGNHLIALLGGQEISVDTVTSDRGGIGHWPWGMWKGHEYGDPKTNFGFGRTFVAIDLETKKVAWHYSDPEYIDSRGVCMNGEHIFFYCPDRFLGCLDTATGELVWKNSDESLLQAIGPQGAAQHYVTGYATTSYIKCNEKQIFFAGPQRPHFVVASAEDGHILWQKRQGNVQVVLREEGIYCAGPQLGDEMAGAKYSYDGLRLASLPIRRACTRATGSIDSVFYRTSGGTVRVVTAENSAEHIAPMRPPCQDGVIISDGLLFWGPWMCGCQLSLYGHICLGPAETAPTPNPTPEPQHQVLIDQVDQVQPFPVAATDWPTYQRDNQRSCFTSQHIPRTMRQVWQQQIVDGALPTAPLVAGNTVFVADRRGVIHSLDQQGNTNWVFRTGGPIYYPPSLENGRLFAGSADGHIYALEAASGRLLWTYRVAPEARRIPVYGALISTWPVAAGVVVQNGIVYGAAGIAHYDGTYVVALTAKDGSLVWRNDTSGALSPSVNCGVSLQGPLQVRDGELQFLGGGAYQFARYDLETGICRNTPRTEVTSQFQTAFYPYYPSYAKYAFLHHTFPNGNTLAYIPTYDGSSPSQLALLGPLRDKPAAAPTDRRGDARTDVPRDRDRDAPQRPVLWKQGPNLHTAFIVTPETLVMGSPPSHGQKRASVAALDMKTGTTIWKYPLPATPVQAGMAIYGNQNLVVSLENGQIVWLEPDPAEE